MVWIGKIKVSTRTFLDLFKSEKNRTGTPYRKKTGQALHKENSDSAMFNEAELTQYFDYVINFKKIKSFSQKKHKK